MFIEIPPFCVINHSDRSQEQYTSFWPLRQISPRNNRVQRGDCQVVSCLHWFSRALMHSWRIMYLILESNVNHDSRVDERIDAAKADRDNIAS